MDSILNSIKKMLGIPEDVDDFDKDLIIYINTVFSIVNQMGVGPLQCFKITGNQETWSDFDTRLDMEEFKTYIYLRVKMMFDPPSNNQIMTSYDNIMKELGYRVHSLWDKYMNSDQESIQEWVEANQ